MPTTRKQTLFKCARVASEAEKLFWWNEIFQLCRENFVHCLLKCKSRVFWHELQRIGKINQSFCCLFAASWKIGSNGEMAWKLVEWNGWQTQAFCSGKKTFALWKFVFRKFLSSSSRDLCELKSVFLEVLQEILRRFTFNFVAVKMKEVTL